MSSKSYPTMIQVMAILSVGIIMGCTSPQSTILQNPTLQDTSLKDTFLKDTTLQTSPSQMPNVKTQSKPSVGSANASLSVPSNTSTPLFQSMLLDKADWQALRQHPERHREHEQDQSQKQVQALLRNCQGNLNKSAQPMAVLEMQPHYNSDGVNKQSQAVGKRLSNDGWMSYRAALCYQLTGDERFAKHSQQILDAWATTLKEIKGGQAKANINFDFTSFIIAGYWVQGVGDWDERAWRDFLRNTILPQSAAHDNDNNHGNWGVLLNASMAVYLQDKTLLDDAYQRWQALIKGQVSDKGVFTREICRSDTNNYCDGKTKGINGLSYTHYAMLPTTMAAQIFAQQGKPIWQTSAGKLLGKAYEQTAIWTQNPSQFPYYERNNGKLNGVRNGAYFYILQHHYHSPAGNEAIAQGDLRLDGFNLKLLFAQ